MSSKEVSCISNFFGSWRGGGKAKVKTIIKKILQGEGLKKPSTFFRNTVIGKNNVPKKQKKFFFGPLFFRITDYQNSHNLLKTMFFNKTMFSDKN